VGLIVREVLARAVLVRVAIHTGPAVNKQFSKLMIDCAVVRVECGVHSRTWKGSI
jgi:hypothetical protein